MKLHRNVVQVNTEGTVSQNFDILIFTHFIAIFVFFTGNLQVKNTKIAIKCVKIKISKI